MAHYKPCGTIHVHQDVAPLKRVGGSERHKRCCGYPRPSGRGSIEALSIIVLSKFWRVYPRPSGRGSIEASGSNDVILLEDCSIHVHQDVAPLKQLRKRYADQIADDYPRPSGRGSIEARFPSRDQPRSTRGYPRPSGRGSIEAPKVRS